ncbi:Conserved_hypothetical protein [Hexamita inflata]|uniref:Uncharacterized protein n=1 Tax=Hexamita inflata TaxID=28002 RepID=A0AA86Q8W7_9EUKA|nr:Conserved hypothetical protein [Hexamita inflata]CAI9954459.1 Conserved hypothetical protein [Hexamita inflata]
MHREVKRWTDAEEQMFLDMLKRYSTDFRLIASMLPDRTYNQVRAHYYNRARASQQGARASSESASKTPSETQESAANQSYFAIFDVYE